MTSEAPSKRDKLLGGAGLLYAAQSVIAVAALAIAWAASDIDRSRDIATLSLQMAALVVQAAGIVLVGLAFLGLVRPKAGGVRAGALIAMNGVILAIVAALLSTTGGSYGYYWLDVLVALLIAALLLPPFAYLAGAYSTEDRVARNNRLGTAATWHAVLAGLGLAGLLILAGIEHLYGRMDFTLVALLVSLAVFIVSAAVASHAFHAAAAALKPAEPEESTNQEGTWLARREGLLLVSAVLTCLVQAVVVAAAIVTLGPGLTGEDAVLSAYFFLSMISGVPVIVAFVLAAIAFSGSRRAALRHP